jgi:hypothetical protein
MREPEASLPTELDAMAELLFRKRRAELAAVFVATTGMISVLLLEDPLPRPAAG